MLYSYTYFPRYYLVVQGCYYLYHTLKYMSYPISLYMNNKKLNDNDVILIESKSLALGSDISQSESTTSFGSQWEKLSTDDDFMILT